MSQLASKKLLNQIRSSQPQRTAEIVRRLYHKKGEQIEEVLTINNPEIAKHLSLPPVKLHCSMLAEDAMKAAVKDCQTTRAKATGSSETPAGNA